MGTREAVLSATESFNEEKEKLVKDSSQSSPTENADRVIFLAQEEARRLGHNFVGTEQILLALIAADKGVAAKTLNSLGVNLEDTRMRVEELIGRGTDVLAEEIPFTPRGKKILLLAWNEARGLGNNYVGTGHLLLAILREGDGIAVRVLENLRVDLNELRANVLTAVKSAQR